MIVHCSLLLRANYSLLLGQVETRSTDTREYRFKTIEELLRLAHSFAREASLLIENRESWPRLQRSQLRIACRVSINTLQLPLNVERNGIETTHRLLILPFPRLRR